MYRTVSLLVYTFGLAAFLGMLALWVRQLRLGRPELRGWLYPTIFVGSAAWFGLNLLTLDYFLLLAAACIFPPLLGRLFGARLVPLLALGCGVVALAAVLYQAEVLHWEAARRDLTLAFCVFFVWSCVSALARRSGGGRLNVALLGGVMVLVPLALYTFSDWMSLAIRSLPLTILIVDSYARRKFLFLDLFAKWGSYFALSLVVLTLWFRLLPRSLNAIQEAVLLLPVLYVVPRVCRTIGEVLDRRVLGRPYRPEEARRLFVERLRETADEATLRAEAEGLLREIFHTQARLGEEDRIVLEERPDGRPLFSEDLELKAALEDLLKFLLENRRLEERRRALAVAATGSELKALRAQINPHFLFNALNTVAGLIPDEPALAERTVERLSEVFRYTLQRSEDEFVRVGEELEFLKAWLDVQKARFGERLEAELEVAADALGMKMPAMALQTLVENAVKHGVARSTVPCRVRVGAWVAGGRLVLEVRDTGPGVAAEERPGHGLKNVRERLAGYYGDGARLELKREGDETVARMEMPA